MNKKALIQRDLQRFGVRLILPWRPAGTYQLITSNTALLKDNAEIIVQRDVMKWTGTVRSNWHNPANWNTGGVPGDQTHVIIPGGTVNPCIISTANAQAASIQLQNGANLQAINKRVFELKGNCAVLPPPN